MTHGDDRLIVALDVPSATEAFRLVEQLAGRCRWFKVGMELFYATGGDLVRRLRDQGCEVFLDLKLYDIPNTVAGAVRSLAATGASLLTLHAAGGRAMMEAAVEAAASTSGAPELLAVTVLTSMDAEDLAEAGVAASPAEQVLRLGDLARSCGVPGLVCSAEETSSLRRRLGPGVRLVVPGIRPAGVDRGDQRRTATPAAALALGASMLVVGRPVTRAPDPRAAVEAILSEMAASESTEAT